MLSEQKQLLIYVSGPMSAPSGREVKDNVDRATAAGIDIMQKGHGALIPHLYYYLHRQALQEDIEYTWQQCMNIDLNILSRCDAMLYLGPSPGADIELEYAKRCGIKIFMSLSEIHNI
jgi:hypothetical protein